MPKTLHQIPKVLVLLFTSFKVHRDCLRGINRYVHLHGPWELHIVEGGRFEQAALSPATFQADGLIAYATDETYVRFIKRFRKPCIVVDPWDDYQAMLPLAQYDTILCDSKSVGRAAADFFLRQKFKHYGYVSIPQRVNNQWSHERCRGFASQVESAGFQCHVYENRLKKAEYDWGFEQQRLIRWLQKLPKQIALLAAMDVRGRQVIEACRTANISVPHEVAVLGVDDDDLLCESTSPPMSSLRMTLEEAAFQACAVLDQRMKNGRSSQSILIPYGPGEVATRRSTNPSAAASKLLIEAVEFIEINACVPIGTKDVAEHLGISRRSLELYFRRELRCTVLDEINRVRLEKVKVFLRETELSIAKIARLAGFNNENHLAHLFRKTFLMTMSEYRKSL